MEERKVAFRNPEYRKVTIVALTSDDLAATLEISDADLKKAYESRRARFETPERRHVKQIVFPTMEEATAAAAKLASGITFEALAADRGLKESDIDLGTVAKTAIVDRAVADAAFGLKAGDVTAPVEGRFGIAIAKVLSIEPATTKAYEEVADEIKKEVAVERARNELVNVQEKIEDERLSGATLADSARKFKLNRARSSSTAAARRPTERRSPTCPRARTCCRRYSPPRFTASTSLMRLPGSGYVWYDVSAIKLIARAPAR